METSISFLHSVMAQCLNIGKLDGNALAEACNISLVEAENIIQQYDKIGDGLLDPQQFEDIKQHILEQQRQNITTDDDEEITMNNNDKHEHDANEEAENIIYQYHPNGDGLLDSEQTVNITDKMDVNDDENNQFDAEELAKVCNISLLEAQNIIAQYDENGDGRLDSDTFETLKQQIMQQHIDNTSDAFNDNISHNQLDNNNNDKITSSEFDIDQLEQKKKEDNMNIDKTDKKVQNNELNTNDNNNNNADNRAFSPFGINPNANKHDPISSKKKPKYAHQWQLRIKFDAENEKIILNVTDDITNKAWTHIITKYDYHGTEIKNEYFRLGKIIMNGNAKYIYPPNGIGAIQVSLNRDDQIYNFTANPI